MIVVDIETTGLDPHTDKILGIGIDGLFEPDIDWAIYLLRGKGITAHNGSFDLKFLWASGVDCTLEFDTMIAAYCLPNRPESLSLGSCAEYYLGESAEWKNTLKKISAQDLPYEDLKAYCLKDIEVTKRLRLFLEQALKNEGLWEFYQQLIKARVELTRAEFKGMNVDWTSLEKLCSSIQQETTAIKYVLNQEESALIKKWQSQQLYEKASKLKTEKGRLKTLQGPAPEFNWSSPSQVLWALKEIGLNPTRFDFKERTIKESSSTEVLESYKEVGRFITPLLKLRDLEKRGSMLESYKELKNKKTERLHGSFNLTVTATGRLSSSKPNMQNQDRSPEVRSLFIPTPGKVFVIGDLAQIEVRVAAHYSKDPILIDMFKREEDFYGTIAKEVLGTPCSPNEVKKLFPNDRAVAKVIGLSILYGTGAKRLQSAIKNGAGRDYSEEACREIIKNYFKKFEGLKVLQKRIEQAINDKGHLTNFFGRKLYINPEDAYMNGANYLLQSTASDFMLFTQLKLNPNKSDLIALVHDELIRECLPEDAESVIIECKRVIEESGYSWRVPMKLDIKTCNNWGEKK